MLPCCALHCIALPAVFCVLSLRIALRCVALLCTDLNYWALRCTALHGSTSLCIVMPCFAFGCLYSAWSCDVLHCMSLTGIAEYALRCTG
eukprot:6195987-Pyramimonas_sp.AAC.1